VLRGLMRPVVIGLVVAAAAAAALVATNGDGEPAASSGPKGATFRACHVESGGFRLRAFALRCRAAARAVRGFRAVRQVAEFRFRDPDLDPVSVSREVVWRAAHRWTCLAQALPRVRTTQFLCVRRRQVLLWRAG
jgi:hypothetical protein